MEWITDPAIWASLATLTALEIVLGIDNVIFLSVISSRLPERQQPLARRLGLALALLMRVALLFGIVWITRLEATLFSVFDVDFSWRDLILVGGGLFLLVKGTLEIHDTIEGEHAAGGGAATAGFAVVVVQIVALDLVFSLDSVITAVGMAEHVEVMIAAVSIAILVMLLAAEPVSDFIKRHPTTKMLALSFLLLVGVALVADGFGFHIPRGYLYFAIAFSILVEMLNLAARTQRRRSGASP
ncbi:MAG: TerC family protein [Alphaproteobacteria bacterium]